MDALPNELPGSGTEAFTGLVCPDCGGNLVLRVENLLVSFHCRVGHAYSTDELVISKEEELEARLWMAVFGFAEFEALLRGLERHGLVGSLGMEACRARAALAFRQAERLRRIVEGDQRITPGPEASDDAAESPTA